MIVILLFIFDSSFQHILLQKVIGDIHKSDFTTNSFFIKQTNIRMSLHRFEHPCFSLVQKVQECTRLVYKKLIYLRQLQQNMSLFFFLSLRRCFSNPLGMSFLALAAATSLGSTTWGGGQTRAGGMLGSNLDAVGLQNHKHNITWIRACKCLPVLMICERGGGIPVNLLCWKRGSPKRYSIGHCVLYLDLKKIQPPMTTTNQNIRIHQINPLNYLNQKF